MSKNHEIEQRAVIRYFMRKHKTDQEIFDELKIVYGDDGLALSTVKSWMTKFRADRDSFENEQRPGPSATVTTDEITDKIKSFVSADRRLNIREIAAEVGISTERVHFVLHEKLGLTKIGARWMPKS